MAVRYVVKVRCIHDGTWKSCDGASLELSLVPRMRCLALFLTALPSCQPLRWPHRLGLRALAPRRVRRHQRLALASSCLSLAVPVVRLSLLSDRLAKSSGSARPVFASFIASIYHLTYPYDSRLSVLYA